jgi:hypothetical protein
VKSYPPNISQTYVQKSPLNKVKSSTSEKLEVVRKQEYLDYPISAGITSVSTSKTTQRLQLIANHKKGITSSLTQYYPRV